MELRNLKDLQLNLSYTHKQGNNPKNFKYLGDALIKLQNLQSLELIL